MASGFAPGAIGQPVQSAPLVPKKKPSVLGQVPQAGVSPVSAPMPVSKPAPVGGVTAVNPTHPVSMPAPGVTPVTGGPLTETVPNLGGAPPVQWGPVGVAPMPATPKPFNLEQTLTNQVQTGAPANPRLGATQGLVDQSAQNLANGPDRTAIAKQAFSDYLSQSGDQFNKDIRSITQRNAASGRLGSGMYGSDLVDAATAADKNRAYAGNQIAQDLANGTINDRFNTTGVLGQLEGQQSGEAQQGVNNLFNYGNSSFDHSLATQQERDQQQRDQFNQYLALLNLNGG